MLRIFEIRNNFENFQEYKRYIRCLQTPLKVLPHLNQLTRDGERNLGVLFDNGDFDSKGCLYPHQMKRLRPSR